MAFARGGWAVAQAHKAKDARLGSVSFDAGLNRI